MIISRIQSICPVCRTVIEAHYINEKELGTGRERVFMVKTCPEHGTYKTLVANDAEEFKAWIARPVVNIPPKVAVTKGAENSDACPLHCGTCENHLQTACCVLIDITARCNQHCPYCFARADSSVKPGSTEAREPSLDELNSKFDLLLELGEERPFNIQLSGGEPTVREDLPEIIKMAKQKGFEYIQLNTNGRRIAEEKGYASILKKAGASVVFMQFDGTNDDIYMSLRNEALLETKRKAVENCRRAGLPVTLVPTIVKDLNDKNIGEIFNYMLENVDVIKGIHFQPVSYFGRVPEPEIPEERITLFDIMHLLEEQTGGRVKSSDLCPISTGHTLCCFYGSFMKEGKGNVKSTLSEATKNAGVSCCETTSCCGEASEMDSAEALAVIRKDRDYVLNKWDLPEYPEEEQCCCDSQAEPEQGCCCCDGAEPVETCCCGGAEPVETCCCDGGEPVETCCCENVMEEDAVMDLDEFLIHVKSNMFTLSGMAFMDGSNLDAERLKRCRVQVLSDDNRLIPFCGYNTIYRKA